MIEFEGQYKNWKRNGKGKEFYDNGKLKFEGEYLDIKRNGKGKHYYLDQLKFEGEYKNWKIFIGTKYDDNGNIIQKFDGTEKENALYNYVFNKETLNKKRNGNDKEFNANGKLIYEGEFLNGERKGNGKEYYKEKLRFEGDYLYGSKINGKFYINEKLRYEGEYLYEKFWNGTGYDEEGNIILNWKMVMEKK